MGLTMKTSMYAKKFAPVRVGKATLENNQLFVGGKEHDLRHSGDFTTFVQTTAALVATAISAVFPDNTGSLIFGDGSVGEIRAEGVTPWQQYSNAVHLCASDLSQSKVIIGWCALLDLYSHILPVSDLESDAVAIARYVATVGFKAAYASSEVYSAWFAYQQIGLVERMEGLLVEPANPWAAAHDLWLPAINTVGEFSALTVIEATSGDIFLKNGSACAGAGLHHFIEVTNDIPANNHLKGDSVTSFVVSGEMRKFRVFNDGESLSFRMLGQALPNPVINFDLLKVD